MSGTPFDETAAAGLVDAAWIGETGSAPFYHGLGNGIKSVAPDRAELIIR
jgi:hypothetical protein